jgi:hypothetical protein
METEGLPTLLPLPPHFVTISHAHPLYSFLYPYNSYSHHLPLSSLLLSSLSCPTSIAIASIHYPHHLITPTTPLPSPPIMFHPYYHCRFLFPSLLTSTTSCHHSTISNPPQLPLLLTVTPINPHQPFSPYPPHLTPHLTPLALPLPSSSPCTSTAHQLPIHHHSHHFLIPLRSPSNTPTNTSHLSD